LATHQNTRCLQQATSNKTTDNNSRTLHHLPRMSFYDLLDTASFLSKSNINRQLKCENIFIAKHKTAVKTLRFA